MKPTKSVYWMTTIILSYVVIFSIVSGLIGSVTGVSANLLIEPILRGMLSILGIYVAVRHIEKKSMVPRVAVPKVSLFVGLVIFAIGALVSFVGGGEAAIQLMVLSIISTVLNAGATYYFLKKAVV